MTELTNEETAHLAEAWGISIETYLAMNDAERMHHIMFGEQPGLCPMGEHIRHIAEASLDERQTTLFEDVRSMNTGAKLHLLLWGAGPCPQRS
jgi:hypothetical protein